MAKIRAGVAVSSNDTAEPLAQAVKASEISSLSLAGGSLILLINAAFFSAQVR